MSTTTAVKTVPNALLAHTVQATAVVTKSSAFDVSTDLAAVISVKLGRSTTTALANNVKFRIEGSFSASDDAEWVPIQEWASLNTTTAANAPTVNDASFNAGDTSFTISNNAGIAAGDILYFRETGTPANSEWSRVSAVSGTTITLEDAVTRSHTNGITVTDLGEMFLFFVNIEAFKRIRLVVDTASSATTTTVDVIAWINTLDSFSTT